MHNCFKCNGSLVEMNMKCYDNISVQSDYLDNSISNIPGSCGIKYDGKNTHFVFCASCGQLQGTFPIRIEKPIANEMPEPVFVAAKIYEFWEHSMKGDDEYCHRLLSWLSVRISPTDCGALSDAFSEFLSVRRMQKNLPEYDELVLSLMQSYQGIKIN